jgi:hypothetical protein
MQDARIGAMELLNLEEFSKFLKNKIKRNKRKKKSKRKRNKSKNDCLGSWFAACSS